MWSIELKMLLTFPLPLSPFPLPPSPFPSESSLISLVVENSCLVDGPIHLRLHVAGHYGDLDVLSTTAKKPAAQMVAAFPLHNRCYSRGINFIAAGNWNRRDVGSLWNAGPLRSFASGISGCGLGFAICW